MVYLRLHRFLAWRFSILAVLFALLFAAIAGRVFTLAIVEHRKYVKAAERQHLIFRVLPSQRGTIFLKDRNEKRQAAALNKTFHTLIAAPKAIREPEAVIQELAEILDLSLAELEAKILKPGDPYEVLARKLDGGKVKAVETMISNFNIGDGLILVEESRRTYPQGNFVANLVGFARPSDEGDEEKGEYGIEKFYNSYLSGQGGFFQAEKDAAGYWVALGRRILNPPVNGDSIVLSIDPNVQFAAEEELEGLVENWGAETGSALILEPKTGRILGAVSRPTYDPNSYSAVKDYSRFRLPLVDSQFELGSVFKPITMAGALNEGLVNAATTYYDAGRVEFGRSFISNFDGRSHGQETMTQVLEKSLNTGAVFVAQKLGPERFRRYIELFGFGDKTGIDFPGEVSGNISNLSSGRDIDYATASFGQGIAVTPLQMAVAMAAIANGGIVMKPYIVERIIDDSGNEEVRGPQEIRRVISTSTAETLTKMLVSAVRNGFENRAGVDGYFVAGKTGTAQIPLQGRRGYSNDVIHTFVGYAPAFNPRFLVLLQLNRPRGNRFAANTLTPAFHNLAKFMLNYYEIPPDER